mmetsp:Transcript_50919/g.160996  ORF Transcript_50919/g.160996 Transcript_50919/m.160996 type:complete len:130 (-) Transcript_50919:264-653(-)|eukprot:CAMPEP_0197653570 /NCGR_PEP_ID=MMETSP1338-20131121/36177_1 /TAXON_ID=43686 ORGANISM="Pelagodinium beii, Strain RCC1491" /NCGR_SAMPLE_ID=MMETSP1338 /ASSEMBLY_ACC=CAM_ASM_000754 /LENGTH=129 /DNA_ID=CAMNT_0043228731 /DNA_START=102 /DNA_END=491 /DNA_ORIENTATION=-
MAFSGMAGSSKEDMLVSLATLALHDGGKDITADNINALVTASGNEVASYWGALFSDLMNGKNIDELIVQPGAGGPAPEGGAAAGGDAAPADDKKDDESSSSAGGDGAGAADLFGGSDSDDDDSDSDSSE